MSGRGVTVVKGEQNMSEGENGDITNKEKNTQQEKNNPSSEEPKTTADPVLLGHLVTIGMDKRLASKVCIDIVVLVFLKQFLKMSGNLVFRTQLICELQKVLVPDLKP